MSKNTKEQEIPYSYLVDNIKIFLIFLVVFNHIIAFQLVKADQVVRFVWYGITIFHMPAFIFISGYLSKKPQDVMKNVKNLLIPYILRNPLDMLFWKIGMHSSDEDSKIIPLFFFHLHTSCCKNLIFFLFPSYRTLSVPTFFSSIITMFPIACKAAFVNFR